MKVIVQVPLLPSRRNRLQNINRQQEGKNQEAQARQRFAEGQLQALSLRDRLTEIVGRVDRENEAIEKLHIALNLNDFHPGVRRLQDGLEDELYLHHDNRRQGMPINADKEVPVEVHSALHLPHHAGVNNQEAQAHQETKGVKEVPVLPSEGDDQEVRPLPEATTSNTEEGVRREVRAVLHRDNLVGASNLLARLHQHGEGDQALLYRGADPRALAIFEDRIDLKVEVL